jgi:hypothetical protein
MLGGEGATAAPGVVADELLNQIANMVNRRVIDPRWELRESITEFLGEFLKGPVTAEVEGLFQTDGLLQGVWALRIDEEAYVRASLLDLFAAIVGTYSATGTASTSTTGTSTLTKYALEVVCEGEATFIQEVHQMMEDTEAIVRRAALQLLTNVLKADILGEKDAATPLLLFGIAASSFGEDTVEPPFATTFGPMVNCIQKAAVDLDWEVKLLALEVVRLCCTPIGMEGIDGDSSCFRDKQRACFQLFNGVSILNDALTDHDRLVRVRSIEICNVIRELHSPSSSASVAAPAIAWGGLHSPELLAFITGLNVDSLAKAASDERTTAEPCWAELVRRPRIRKKKKATPKSTDSEGNNVDGADDSDDSESDEEANTIGCY